jgi:hypothetical protein
LIQKSLYRVGAYFKLLGHLADRGVTLLISPYNLLSDIGLRFSGGRDLRV